MPVVGALGDQGSRFDFARPHGGGFFDFQCAAVAFCVERLQAGQDAVLALDTGLGKTVVLRGILQALRNAKPPFHASSYRAASDAAATERKSQGESEQPFVHGQRERAAGPTQ